MIKSIWNNIKKRVNGLIDKIRHKEPWYKYYGNNQIVFFKPGIFNIAYNALWYNFSKGVLL